MIFFHLLISIRHIEILFIYIFPSIFLVLLNRFLNVNVKLVQAIFVGDGTILWWYLISDSFVLEHEFVGLESWVCFLTKFFQVNIICCFEFSLHLRLYLWLCHVFRILMHLLWILPNLKTLLLHIVPDFTLLVLDAQIQFFNWVQID